MRGDTGPVRREEYLIDSGDGQPSHAGFVEDDAKLIGSGDALFVSRQAVGQAA